MKTPRSLPGVEIDGSELTKRDSTASKSIQLRHPKQLTVSDLAAIMTLNHACGHPTQLTPDLAKLHKLTSDKIELADDNTFYLTFNCDACLGLREDDYLMLTRINELAERMDNLNEKASEMLKKAVAIGEDMLKEMAEKGVDIGETKSVVHETFATYELMARKMAEATKK